MVHERRLFLYARKRGTTKNTTRLVCNNLDTQVVLGHVCVSVLGLIVMILLCVFCIVAVEYYLCCILFNACLVIGLFVRLFIYWFACLSVSFICTQCNVPSVRPWS